MNQPSLFLAALGLACGMHVCLAATPAAAPDLDVQIRYYSKILTPEGVTRESRYEETMLRRPGHVWVSRTLPAPALDAPAAAGAVKKTGAQASATPHASFNHVVLPRHVVFAHGKLRLEYVDAHAREVIAIPPAEFENVNFDGSWERAYYLLDPKLLKAIPPSTRLSAIPGAQWRERESNGGFERVLWDELRQLPLVIETGDKAATVFQRIVFKPQTNLTTQLPWNKLAGYAQKEYSDFLD
jgi:hypothetical protein